MCTTLVLVLDHENVVHWAGEETLDLAAWSKGRFDKILGWNPDQLVPVLLSSPYVDSSGKPKTGFSWQHLDATLKHTKFAQCGLLAKLRELVDKSSPIFLDEQFVQLDWQGGYSPGEQKDKIDQIATQVLAGNAGSRGSQVKHEYTNINLPATDRNDGEKGIVSDMSEEDAKKLLESMTGEANCEGHYIIAKRRTEARNSKLHIFSTHTLYVIVKGTATEGGREPEYEIERFRIWHDKNPVTKCKFRYQLQHGLEGRIRLGGNAWTSFTTPVQPSLYALLEQLKKFPRGIRLEASVAENGRSTYAHLKHLVRESSQQFHNSASPHTQVGQPKSTKEHQGRQKSRRRISSSTHPLQEIPPPLPDGDVVVVSYNTAQEDLMWQVCTDLWCSGYEVFNGKQVPAGHNWREVYFDEYLPACSVTIAMVSHEFMQSQDCTDELETMHGLKKRIIPLKLTKYTMPTRMMPMLKNAIPSTAPDTDVVFDADFQGNMTRLKQALHTFGVKRGPPRPDPCIHVSRNDPGVKDVIERQTSMQASAETAMYENLTPAGRGTTNKQARRPPPPTPTEEAIYVNLTPAVKGATDKQARRPPPPTPTQEVFHGFDDGGDSRGGGERLPSAHGTASSQVAPPTRQVKHDGRLHSKQPPPLPAQTPVILAKDPALNAYEEDAPRVIRRAASAEPDNYGSGGDLISTVPVTLLTSKVPGIALGHNNRCNLTLDTSTESLVLHTGTYNAGGSNLRRFGLSNLATLDYTVNTLFLTEIVTPDQKVEFEFGTPAELLRFRNEVDKSISRNEFYYDVAQRHGAEELKSVETKKQVARWMKYGDWTMVSVAEEIPGTGLKPMGIFRALVKSLTIKDKTKAVPFLFLHEVKKRSGRKNSVQDFQAILEDAACVEDLEKKMRNNAERLIRIELAFKSPGKKKMANRVRNKSEDNQVACEITDVEDTYDFIIETLGKIYRMRPFPSSVLDPSGVHGASWNKRFVPHQSKRDILMSINQAITMSAPPEKRGNIGEMRVTHRHLKLSKSWLDKKKAKNQFNLATVTEEIEGFAKFKGRVIAAAYIKKLHPHVQERLVEVLETKKDGPMYCAMLRYRPPLDEKTYMSFEEDEISGFVNLGVPRQHDLEKTFPPGDNVEPNVETKHPGKLTVHGIGKSGEPGKPYSFEIPPTIEANLLQKKVHHIIRNGARDGIKELKELRALRDDE